MQKEFVDFIKKHHVFSLATCEDNISWSASCFYAYDEIDNVFVFSSALDTKHAKMMIKNPNVSGTIALETKEVGKIEGLQFSGMVSKADANSKKLYLKTYPFALALKPKLWQIKIVYAKLTDNRLFFGKKLEFQL